MRTPIIVANWKMHKTVSEVKEFITTLGAKLSHVQARIFIAPPFTAIPIAIEASQGTKIVIGAQNMHEEQEGAFTGEISAPMLKEVGARFVILGHSERRSFFHETDVQINKKMKRAISNGLLPLLCIGETEKERKNKKTEKTLSRQLETALQEVVPCELVIAYEPVWAIGTGKTATAEEAGAAHALCRSWFAQTWGKGFADRINILYGGSVTPPSAPELFRHTDIDGVLVGGSSLDIEKFHSIIQGAYS